MTSGAVMQVSYREIVVSLVLNIQRDHLDIHTSVICVTWGAAAVEVVCLFLKEEPLLAIRFALKASMEAAQFRAKRERF